MILGQQHRAREGVREAPSAPPVARSLGDQVFAMIAQAAGASTLIVMVLIGTFLAVRAMPALRSAGWRFFTETLWRFSQTHPVFGIAAVLYWTAVIATMALIMAVPLALATAIYITEYAPPSLRRPLVALIDLLAAVPSLIFGMWGLFFLQPRMLGISRWLSLHMGFVPIFRVTTGHVASSPFIASLVVALMILPIITSVSREVFSQAPVAEREGALALGATRWGMIRTVLWPFGRGGVVGGSMLGLGRALGETIAVALILSPSFFITPRVLEGGGNSIAALIALRFGEARSTELSALMAAGLTLFGVTLIVNVLSTVVVARSRSGRGVEI